MNIRITFALYVVVKCLAILHRTSPGFSDNHCLCLTAKLFHDRITEMLHDDFNPLSYIRLMELDEPCNLPLGVTGLHRRIVLYLLVELEESAVSNIVLQYVQDESFLNGLLHGVDVESFTFSLWIDGTENLKGGGLWSGRKCKHRHVILLA